MDMSQEEMGLMGSELRRGVATLKADWARFGALAAGVLPGETAEAVQADWTQYAEEKEAYAAELPNYVKNFEELEEMGDYGTFLAGNVIRQVPLLASLIIPGTAGRVIAGKIATKLGATVAGIEKAKTAGGLVAAGTADYGLLTGETAGGIAEQGVDPSDVPGRVFATGAFKTLMDFGPWYAMAKTMGLSKLVSFAEQKALKNAGFLRRVGNNMGMLLATEIPTETAQELMDIIVEDTIKAAEDQGILTPENKSRLVNAAAAAATMSVLGIPAAAFKPRMGDEREEVGAEEDLLALPAPALRLTDQRVRAEDQVGEKFVGPLRENRGFDWGNFEIGDNALTYFGEEVQGEAPIPLTLVGESDVGPTQTHAKGGERISSIFKDSAKATHVAERITILKAGKMKSLTQAEMNDAEARRLEATTRPVNRTPRDNFILFQARKRRIQKLRETAQKTTPAGFAGPLTERGMRSDIILPETRKDVSRVAQIETLMQRLRDDQKNYRRKDGKLKVAIEKKLARLEDQISNLQENIRAVTEVSQVTPEVAGSPAVFTPPVKKEPKVTIEPMDEKAPGREVADIVAEEETPVIQLPGLTKIESKLLTRLEEKEAFEGLDEREYGVLEKLMAKASGEQIAGRQGKQNMQDLLAEGDEAAEGDTVRTKRNIKLGPLAAALAAKRGRGSLDPMQISNAIEGLEAKFNFKVTIMNLRDMPTDLILHTDAVDSHGVYVQFQDGSREVFLIADNIASIHEAQTTYLHEVVGHFGIRSLLTEKELVALQRAGGFDTMAEVEEHIAKTAENGHIDPSFLSKVIAMVRRALRRMGINIKLSVEEVQGIIASSAHALQGQVITKYSPEKTDPAASTIRATKTKPSGILDKYVMPLGTMSPFTDIAGRPIGVGGMDAHGTILDKIASENGLNLPDQGGEERFTVERMLKLIYIAGDEKTLTYIAPTGVGTREEVIAAALTHSTLFDQKIEIEYEGKKIPAKEIQDFKLEGEPPITAMYRKMDVEGGAQMEHDVANWKSLWGINVGKWILTPLQMDKRYGRLAPESKAYLNTVDSWWVTKTDLMGEATPVAEKWNKLNDVQGKRLGEALFEAVIASEKAERKLTKAETIRLLDRLKLDAETQAIYWQVKESLTSTLNRLEQGLKYNAVREVLDDETKAREFLERWDASENNDDARLDLLQEYKIEGEILEGSSLSQNLNTIQEDMTRMRERDYFPHMRFGKNAVVMRATRDGVVYEGTTFNKGQIMHFETHTDHRSQKQAAEQLRKDAPMGTDVKATVMKDTEFSFVGMPPGLMDTLTNELELTPVQKQDLKEIFIRVSPGRAFLRHLIQRRGVAGFSADAQRVFATYMLNAANHIARVEHYKDMTVSLEALEMRQKGIDPVATRLAKQADPAATSVLLRDTDVRKVGVLSNYYRKHYKYIMNPGNDLAKLRAMGFMWYLGFNAKSAVVNLSQVPLVTYPYLASQFSDGRAVGAIKDAMPAAGKLITGKGKHGLDADMLEVLSRLSDLLDESIATELAGFSESTVLERIVPKTEIGRFYSKMSLYSAWMFRNAEKYNRHVTAIAAAKLAFEDGASVDQAVTIAKDAIQTTQFEYAKWNRPEFMRGKKSVFFLFWQYMQHATFLAAGGHGAGTAARFWLLLAMAAGLQGLPFAENLMDIIDWSSTQMKKLTGSNNPKTDVRIMLREFLNSLTDNAELTDGIMHGASRYYGLGPLHVLEAMGIPVPNTDVSGSISLGQPIPGLRDLVGHTRSPEEKFGRSVVEMMGPVMGMPYAIWRSAQDTNPDSWKKWERAMPVFLKSASRAARISSRGGEEFRGGGELIDYDPQDIDHRVEQIAQVFGLTPTRLSQAHELNAAQQQAKQWYTMRRSLLLEDYVYAKRNRKREMMADVKKAIRVFNHSAPTKNLKIGQDTIARSWKERQRRAQLRTQGEPSAKMYRGLYHELEEVFPEK
jgi:hypothetical protein